MRLKRGTALPGVLAIILVFLIALSWMAFLIIEFRGYFTSVKSANTAVSERNRESLLVTIGRVQGNNIVALNVTNIGSTGSLVVGLVKVNPSDKNPTFIRLDQPVAVRPLMTVHLPINAVPSKWAVGVWTSYGNIFWAGEPSTGVNPPGGSTFVTFDATGLGNDASGTVLVVDGISYSFSELPRTFTWDVGSTHSFEWKAPVSGATGVMYVWTSTSGLMTSQSGQLTVSSSGYVIATYKTQYSLTVQVSPGGSGTTSLGPGTYWYDSGSLVQISASPNSGWAFEQWVGSGSGSYSGTSSSASVTMNGPI
ncbi:MAG: hypothetical protein FGF50_09265, partial [Candidatus Brockarchaeota archaeon]|nr:hypothetical protein [Candidatus Brockarchaeota archaeon]